MLNIFIYFNLMFMMFLMFLMMGVSIYYFNYSVILEWMILSQSSLNFEFLIYVDWMSMIFISIIFLISSLIMLYSYMYMEGEFYFKRFIYLVILFIMSMILMIFSPNGMSILFGWDGLGLTSYLLVIYYQNFSSFNSGMVTVLCNRIGDVGILMFISLMMMKGGWNFWMINKEGNSYLMLLMLMLASVTKSAQIPFSVWLPMAMAAPTPVSSLVHSSTLVTAGVYLMIRFNELLKKVSELSVLLFFFSVLTMFMSGLMANFENDLKKIIALSTLSQLGVMMMILSWGFKYMAFYHLLVHAIFKSMLFMCAGILIHFMMDSQDIRVYGNLKDNVPFVLMSFYIGSLALCGMPFMSGFYSKDSIMELVLVYEINIFMLLMVLLSLVFTVSYTVRLIYYLYFSNMKFYSYNNVGENSLMNKSMSVLMILSISIGALLNWMFFFDFSMVYLHTIKKTMVFVLCLGGISMGVLLTKFNFLKIYYLSFYLSSMWFLQSLYMWVYFPLNMLGVVSWEIDKTWLEFLMIKSIQNLFINMNKKIMYKMYMFLLLYVSSIILLILMV